MPDRFTRCVLIGVMFNVKEILMAELTCQYQQEHIELALQARHAPGTNYQSLFLRVQVCYCQVMSQPLAAQSSK